MKPGQYFRCRKKPDRGNFTVGKVYKSIESSYTDDDGERFRFIQDERREYFRYLCYDEVMLTLDITPETRLWTTPMVEKILKERGLPPLKFCGWKCNCVAPYRRTHYTIEGKLFGKIRFTLKLKNRHLECLLCRIIPYIAYPYSFGSTDGVMGAKGGVAGGWD